MRKTLPIFVLTLLSACDYLFPVNDVGPRKPLGPAYVGPLVTDFRYFNSPNFPGYIRFVNLSKGMSRYEWDMGFRDSGGKTVVSYVPNPNIRYPANGFYTVTLKASDRGDNMMVRSMVIQVTNL